MNDVAICYEDVSKISNAKRKSKSKRSKRRGKRQGRTRNATSMFLFYLSLVAVAAVVIVLNVYSYSVLATSQHKQHDMSSSAYHRQFSRADAAFRFPKRSYDTSRLRLESLTDLPPYVQSILDNVTSAMVNTSNTTTTTTTTYNNTNTTRQPRQQQQQQQQQQQAMRDEAIQGKERIVALLQDAGIDMSTIDIRILQLLPKWKDVEYLYGKQGPIFIHNKNKNEHSNDNKNDNLVCDSSLHGYTLGIAGMFDSGTNLAADYLESNCLHANILWQVPWGKHVLAKNRHDPAYHHQHHPQKHHLPSSSYVSKDATSTNKTNKIVPVVMIRDPYFWMQSMCVHNYGAQWLHSMTGQQHCPNLVPNAVDYALYPFPTGTIPVRVKFHNHQNNNNHNQNGDAENTNAVVVEKWDSLIHLWTEWYRQYYDIIMPSSSRINSRSKAANTKNVHNNDKDQEYEPIIMVRYEDFLFYPKETTRRICECVGGRLISSSSPPPQHPSQDTINADTTSITTRITEPFRYAVESSKFGPGHGAAKTSWISAMIRYGRMDVAQERRTYNMTPDDLALAQQVLEESQLMQIFSYRRL